MSEILVFKVLCLWNNWFLESNSKVDIATMENIGML